MIKNKFKLTMAVAMSAMFLITPISVKAESNNLTKFDGATQKNICSDETIASKFASNKEYFNYELGKINAKYGTNFYAVSDFDYEKISRAQLDDSINSILGNFNKVCTPNANKLSVNCTAANSTVSIPATTILCAMWPVKLEGTVSYTADSGKFKSIDSVNTWITGDEFLIMHTWTLRSWDSTIINGGKSARVNLRGTLKGEMLIKGSPIAFNQEVDETVTLDF